MRSCNTNRIFSLAATAMLAAVVLTPITASAAPVVPPSGAPAFIFNDSISKSSGGIGFAADIRNWFGNYTVARNVGGSVSLDAHNEGAFTYKGTLTDDYADVADYAGTDGVFDLHATLGPLDYNSLTGDASGTVKITGAVAAMGILNPNSILMTADVIGYGLDADSTFGLAIDNIFCHSAIKFCATTQAQIESVRFKFDSQFVMDSADGYAFRTGMYTTTTVPVPAAVWLMLSGLGWMGIIARRRKA